MSAIDVERRDGMLAAIVGGVPFAHDAPFRIVELGSGDGRLSAMLLERFTKASLLALEGSDAMRAETARHTAAFGDRVRVRSFDVTTLDWWDLMHGAGVVISVETLHRLNEAKTQYLYKAVAERLVTGGAVLIADTVRPMRRPEDGGAPLFHHFIWLRHAGFAAVDCLWLAPPHAVFGGFKLDATSRDGLRVG